MICDHSSPHSGAAGYLHDTGQLRLVLVCDRCGAERAELGSIDYRPVGHRLVGQLAEITARELGLSDAEVARVRLAALICDVGRAQIPAAILNKRGPLSPEEWAAVRRQPELGAALLSGTSFDDVREWILCHRERPDGSGYPRGLRDHEIPLEARILSATDAYAAMTIDRPHRGALSHERASRELRRCAGEQFDPDVVEALLRGLTARRPLGLVRAAA
jgi:HD-GYP domain-containing protein (c-di-GMP phosphodiesterase class II)